MVLLVHIHWTTFKEKVKSDLIEKDVLSLTEEKGIDANEAKLFDCDLTETPPVCVESEVIRLI